MKREDVVWRKASKSLQKGLSVAGEDYSDFAIMFLLSDAQDFLLDIGGVGADSSVPIYTGNLRDSIGVRILKGNTIKGYVKMTDVSPKLAKRPQRMKGIKNIWGEEEIIRVLNRPSRRTSKSVAAQLMVGVPYAESVDEEQGYFEELFDRFGLKMTNHLNELRKHNYIMKV